jgi:hypothetical protein
MEDTMPVTITLDDQTARQLLIALSMAVNGASVAVQPTNGNGNGNGYTRAAANPAGPQATPEQIEEWADRYGDVFNWIYTNYGRKGFATDLFEKSLLGYGALTDAQYAAVNRILGHG